LHLEVVLDEGADDFVDIAVGRNPSATARGACNACGQPEMICWICGSDCQRVRA
jgi:hypothetical protein